MAWAIAGTSQSSPTHAVYMSATSAGTTVGSTTTALPTTQLSESEVILAVVFFDNTSTTAPTTTSISKPAGENANWTLLCYVDSPQASAAGGVRGELWGIKPTVDWVGHFPTATISASVARRAITWFRFLGGTLNSREVTPKVGNSATGTATTSSSVDSVDGELVFGFGITENNAAPALYSGDGGFGGTWYNRGSATGSGGAAANIGYRAQYKVPVTATGTQTLSLSTIDGGTTLIALEPAPAETGTPKEGSDTGSIGVSETSSIDSSEIQMARPDGTGTVVGIWTGSHLDVDEVIPDDNDFIASSTNPAVEDFYSITLSSLQTPQAGPHTIRFRYAKDADAGRDIQLQVQLRQGDGQVITDRNLGIIANSTFQQDEYTLTPEEVALITDYEDLRFRFVPTASGGGGGRAARISWLEFEVPEAVPVEETIPQASSDTGSISVGETSSLEISGTIEKAGSETRSLAVSETSSLQVSGTVLKTASDTPRIGLTESGVIPAQPMSALSDTFDGTLDTSKWYAYSDFVYTQDGALHFYIDPAGNEASILRSVKTYSLQNSEIVFDIQWPPGDADSFVDYTLLNENGQPRIQIMTDAFGGFTSTMFDNSDSGNLGEPIYGVKIVESGGIVTLYLRGSDEFWYEFSSSSTYGESLVFRADVNFYNYYYNSDVFALAAINPVVAGPTTSPVSGSDSSQLSVSESAQIFKTIAASDSASLAVSEVSNTGSDSLVPGMDSTTLGVSETVSIAVTQVSSDESSLGVVDLSQTTVQVSASETRSLAVADRRSLTDTAGTNLYRLRPAVDVSFETGAVPTLGYPFGHSGTYTVTVVDVPDAPDGLKALRVEVLTSGTFYAEIFSRVPIMTTTNYYATAYVKQVAGSPRNLGLGIAYTTLETGGGSSSGYSMGGNTTSSWVRRTFSGLSTATSEWARPVVRIENAVAGDVFLLDAFQLTSVSNSPYNPVSPVQGKVGNDAASLAVNEVANTQDLLSDLPANESFPLGVTEEASILVSTSTSDSAGLGTIETTTSARTIVASDTATLAITEVSSTGSDMLVPGSDSSSVGVGEEVAIFVTASDSDDSNITSDESREQSVSFSAVEQPVISASENIETAVTTSASDSATLAANETSNIGSTLPGTEIIALGVVEESSFWVSSSHSDEIAIALSEDASVYVETQASDQAGVTVQETTSGYTEFTTEDSSSITLTDSAGLSGGDNLPANEVTSLSVVEQTYLSITDVDTDTADLGVVETSSISSTRTHADASALAVQESALIHSTRSASDSVSLSVTDVSSVSSTLPGQDNIALGAAEQRIIFVSLAASDGATIAASENTTSSLTVVTSENVSLSVVDTSAMNEERTNKSAIDAVSIAVSETSATQVFRSVSGTDSLGIGVSEQTTGFREKTATDSLVIGAAETTGRNSELPGVEQLSLGLVEQASLFVVETTADEVTIGLAESVEVFSDIAEDSTDEAAVQVDEQSSIDVTLATTSFIEDDDSIGIGIEEASEKFAENMKAELLVFINGEWRAGTPMIYKNGKWIKSVGFMFYVNGEWITAT